jgi:hypothetical protein
MSDPLIDHTIAARKHAQFIANAFADEARLSDHSFRRPAALYSSLIRHSQLAQVQYVVDNTTSTMPPGLDFQEIYLFK